MAGTLEDKSIWEDGEESLGEEVLRMPTDEIQSKPNWFRCFLQLILYSYFQVALA